MATPLYKPDPMLSGGATEKPLVEGQPSAPRTNLNFVNSLLRLANVRKGPANMGKRGGPGGPNMQSLGGSSGPNTR